jgi:hypothetical protein
MKSIIPLIKGEQVLLTKLQSITDENKIKKVILLTIHMHCNDQNVQLHT